MEPRVLKDRTGKVLDVGDNIWYAGYGYHKRGKITNIKPEDNAVYVDWYDKTCSDILGWSAAVLLKINN